MALPPILSNCLIYNDSLIAPSPILHQIRLFISDSDFRKSNFCKSDPTLTIPTFNIRLFHVMTLHPPAESTSVHSAVQQFEIQQLCELRSAFLHFRLSPFRLFDLTIPSFNVMMFNLPAESTRVVVLPNSFIPTTV